MANKPPVLYTYTPDIILDSSSLLALSCCLIIKIPSLIHLMCSCSQKLDFDLAMSQREYWDLLPYDPIPAWCAPLSLACSVSLCHLGWHHGTFGVRYHHLTSAFLHIPPVPCSFTLFLILSFSCSFRELLSYYCLFAQSDPPDLDSLVALTFRSLLQTSFHRGCSPTTVSSL